jgi:AraC-like DNA-binding protein
MHEGIQSGDASSRWLEDRFVALAATLLELRGRVRREIETFPGLRPATREELYRRLHRGRDFLESSYARPVTMAMAADSANMSPYHFHHIFQRAFRQTPNRFLQEGRLEAARRLLLATNSDVTSICLDVGFQSLGSFSSLFRRRHGLSPRGFREASGTAVRTER